MSKILAADIGGTKTILALYEIVDGIFTQLAHQQYASQSFGTFNEIIFDFRERYSTSKIDAACLGIAGPIIDSNCNATNLPWKINSNELKEQLNTTRIKLLNDLEATAYGMLYLDESSFLELNPSAHAKESNRAVIAAGTGLGEAQLFWNGVKYQPIGSEGGHCDFAPLTSQQDALLAWLRNHFPSHVSYERILSGPGISTLYDFLTQSGFASQPDEIAHCDPSQDRSALISHYALEKKDPLCCETLRLFCEIYGAEAGNLALKSMSLGGVYIGGGIAAKILPFLSNGTFLEAFVKKGRFETLLRSMSVKVSLDPHTALLGASRYAYDQLL